jgi:hypothetical protein
VINSSKMRLAFAGFLGLLLAITATLLVLRRIENHRRLERLYCEASGAYPYFHDTDSSVKAVHEIGSYRGDKAEKMLFKLASNNSDSSGIGISIPVAAIRELQVRRDPRIPEFLAGHLKTETVIDKRRAAAKALQSLSCDRGCATELLQYLEQIDKGSLNVEDTVVEPNYDYGPNPRVRQAIEASNQRVRNAIEAEQKEIYGLLYTALLNQSKTTNSVLTDAYGLGSSAPKNFAIDFVVQSQDKDACSALEESVKAIGHSTVGASDETQTRLKHAIEVLKCN